MFGFNFRWVEAERQVKIEWKNYYWEYGYWESNYSLVKFVSNDTNSFPRKFIASIRPKFIHCSSCLLSCLIYSFRHGTLSLDMMAIDWPVPSSWKTVYSLRVVSELVNEWTARTFQISNFFKDKFVSQLFSLISQFCFAFGKIDLVSALISILYIASSIL